MAADRKTGIDGKLQLEFRQRSWNEASLSISRVRPKRARSIAHVIARSDSLSVSPLSLPTREQRAALTVSPQPLRYTIRSISSLQSQSDLPPQR